jgi:hypothetical protein
MQGGSQGSECRPPTFLLDFAAFIEDERGNIVVRRAELKTL